MKSRTQEMFLVLCFFYLSLEEEMVQRENVEYERYLWVTYVKVSRRQENK